jgi:hypothetical protein
MHDQPSEKRWPIRLLLVGVGSILSTLGIVGFKNGILWIPKLSQWFGRVTFTPTLSMVVFGLILVLIGLIPWGKSDLGTKRKRE